MLSVSLGVFSPPPLPGLGPPLLHVHSKWARRCHTFCTGNGLSHRGSPRHLPHASSSDPCELHLPYGMQRAPFAQRTRMHAFVRKRAICLSVCLCVNARAFV